MPSSLTARLCRAPAAIVSTVPRPGTDAGLAPVIERAALTCAVGRSLDVTETVEVVVQETVEVPQEPEIVKETVVVETASEEEFEAFVRET